MDFATLIGLFGALLLIASAVILGVSPDVFINSASLLIVVGGSLLVVPHRWTWILWKGSSPATPDPTT